MTMEFYLVATLLILVAIAFVLMPLLRRDIASSQDQLVARKLSNVANYQAEKEDIQNQLSAGDIDQQQADILLSELDQSLVEDSRDDNVVTGKSELGLWWLAPIVIIPLMTLGVYQYKGGLDEIVLQDKLLSLKAPESLEEQRTQLQSLHADIQAVAARHGAKKPDYLVLAGQTAMNLQDYAAAEDNYAALAKTYPDDAEVIAYWAQAAFLASDRQMTPRIEGLTQRALALDEKNTTALGLVGIAAFESQDYARAVESWGKIVQNMPANSPDAAVIMQGINSAIAMAAERGETLSLPEVDRGPVIKVSVKLSDELLAQGLDLSEQAILFVFAQAETGPKMPLAVQRLSPRQLPVSIELDDNMGMTPAMRLSQFENVIVSARISQSGAVASNPGDYQVGEVIHLNLKNTPLIADLVIDKRLP